ncbi:MAG: ribose-phosphate pyrophosphokinase [Pseudobutyrivibrio sp.]|uniref:ribose-phosphate pyrophosphokinase n=1 Tax=Pseudobutyrivibrio sp. TaxID=2014367 RepID=UPI0025E95EF2|nr:ribose-phosphate pyrophosphokinase [Pseudobutyrivibrio sp.]MBQ6461853.1 ribose-phosphate pyrophosphokinase [Pseudobutyrivibrio sp.]MBQ8490671.1 ribose-phosphate pyrophosphokinase [Pseudobutyrivibrio sp.]
MEDKLGLITLESFTNQTQKINEILCKWRGCDNYIIPSKCPRFTSGEAKGVIEESVRDKDIYILVDVCNNSLKYKMDGELNRMSPDDHYQDLKRIIMACNGKPNRITVIMPFLYEGRQHRRMIRESLDCAMMLRELEFMGVDDIVTFDAHDSRMQNVLPLRGIENISPALQFVQGFLTEYEDIKIDGEHLMIIAPDEGATERAVFYASLFGVNLGMFYKRRNYSTIIDGINPIVAHDFCGSALDGMDAIVVDDMIASGGSIIDVCKQIKERGAKRVFIFSTFGLFTSGFDKMDRAYEEGLFDRIFTTNLVYQKPELLEKEYYYSINMNRYIAAIIDTLNKKNSMQQISKPEQRIKETIMAYLG